MNNNQDEILIYNSYMFTMDENDNTYQNGYIRIQGNIITEIQRGKPYSRACITIARFLFSMITISYAIFNLA